MNRLYYLFLVTLILCSVPCAWAQDTATIVGAVTDASGAVIPDAHVTVSNPDKGYTRELVANSAGEYTAARVPIGNYQITSEARGFRKLVRSGITLTVGQTLRVDLQMTVGAVTQEVTVTGNVPRVETETATVSDVVNGTQVTQLMLNGRNFTDLYQLIPGVVMDNSYDPTQIGINGFANFSINGSRMEYNNLEYDGGDISDEGSGGSSATVYPSLDSIAEFRITTSNYGADQGKHGAGQIEVASKAGTKDFHGDLYEFVRNDKFDANDFFTNRTINPPGGNAPKVPLKWNDFGFTFGGPFYIPNHYNSDKSKTFFFYSQEFRRYRQGTVLSNGVPSSRERTGDFSECDPQSGNYNPLIASGCVLPTVTGVTYDTVQSIPGYNAQAFTNATDLLQAYFPLPNNGVDNWISAPSVPTNWREEQIRVDQNISTNTRAFVRFTTDAWNTITPTPTWASGSYDTVQTPFNGPSKAAVLHITHTFNPALMNEFVASYYEDWIYLYQSPGPDSPAHSINKPSNWAANHLFAPNAGNPLLPAVSVTGGISFGSAAEDAGNHPWFNSNPIAGFKDSMTDVKSNHMLKFGVYLQRYRKNEQYGTDTQGSLTFSNTSAVTTGNALADMYLGDIGQYTEGTEVVNGVAVGGYPKGHWRYSDLELYLQDDWKVKRNLTLNIGLRYYYFSPWHDVSRPITVDSAFLPQLYNPAAEAQLNAQDAIIPGTGHYYETYGNGLEECGTNGTPAGCRLLKHLNLGPRFGFSWDPKGNGKTAIRGGYGIYYEPGDGNESNPEGGEGNAPVAFAPSGFNIVGYSSIVPGALGPTSYVAIPWREGWPTVQQFSLTVQHQFTSNDLVTIGYVGNLGRDLARSRNLNQVPDGATTMVVPALAGTNPYCNAQGVCNVQQALISTDISAGAGFFSPYPLYGNPMWMKEYTAVSDYNSLQVNFRHTFGHGLNYQAAYTWAHTLDDSTSTYNNPVDSVDDSKLTRWYGTSALDRAHVLTMNYTYDMPFFKKSANRFVRSGIGGWELSGITSFFTGEPLDISCGIAGMSTGIGSGVRCNTGNGFGVSKYTINDPQFGPTRGWFNPSLLVQPLLSQLPSNGEPGMFGYQARNPLIGPGRNNWDMGLFKNFETPWFAGEHGNLQFRLETFNTFNHAQWKGVNASCSSVTAPGAPCNGANNIGNGEVNSDWGPRIMQLSLKFIF